jgi:hypothetical protein
MSSIEFNFRVTYDEANVIIAGLQELPAKIANPLTQKLQQQAQEQMPKAEAGPGLEVVK